MNGLPSEKIESTMVNKMNVRYSNDTTLLYFSPGWSKILQLSSLTVPRHNVFLTLIHIMARCSELGPQLQPT